MNNKTKYIIIFSGLCSIPVLANDTTEIRPFIGVKGGWQIADDNLYRHTNPNNYLWGVYGGLQFTPLWSWDLGFQDQGKLDADATQIKVKTALIESAIRYDLNITDNMGLYGRLGLAYWDMEKNQKLAEKLTDTGFSPLGEIGINYQVTPNVYLNTGYQYIHGIGSNKTGEYDSHSIVAGISYHFGKQDKRVEPLKTIEPQIVTQVAVMKPRQLSSITFGFDEAIVSPSGKNKLVETLTILNQYPQAQVEIIGYTDPKGSNSYNDKLSVKRAKQVALTLEQDGIQPSRMIVQGKGEVKLAPNASPKDFAESRRVDIQLLPLEYEKKNDI